MQTGSERRIAALDALRALAAFLVLASHVAFWTGEAGWSGVGIIAARGDVGVAVFFALSAFLLVSPWWPDPVAPRTRPGAGRYALRRAGRLLPAYWVAFIGVLAVGAAVGGRTGARPLPGVHLIGDALLLQGFTQVTPQTFTQTWSLTTELCFYAIVPALGAVLARRRAATVLPAAAVLGIAVQGLVAAGLGHGRVGAALGMSLLGHAAWFAVGIAVLGLRRGGRRLPVPDDGGTWILVAAAAFALSCTPLASPGTGPGGLAAPHPGQAMAKEALFALVAGALLLAATVPGRSPAWVAAPLVRHLGRVSYGVFLWHLVVLQVVFAGLRLPLFGAPFGWVLVLVTTATVAVASLSWRFVEAPAIRATHRDDRAGARP